MSEQRPPPTSAERGQAVLRLAPGQVLAGRYRVLELLGRGGMGLVLAAYDSWLDRRVALKLLLPALTASGREREAHHARLLREAQAMARLSHPHVVSLYDSGALEGGPLYLAMEYVQGQTTLRQWLEAKPRTWREVLDTYVKAGRGLAAMHAAGLLHRDFKPENVLVAHDGRVRVTDLGVEQAGALSLSSGSLPTQPDSQAEGAREITPVREQALDAGIWETPLTLPGRVMGTPHHLAPELLQGQPADVRTDVFAYCVALYESLYGQPAYGPRGDAQGRLSAQQQGKVNALPASSHVPQWVARAVLRGLRAAPGERPASMTEMLAALENDPTVRRRARLRVAAVAGLLLALGGLAVESWRRKVGPGCAQLARERLVGVWDEPLQARLREALLGTGLSYARDTSERVEAALEEYTGQWVQRRTQVCEAGEAPTHKARLLAVRQMYCLERRRSQVQALMELLTRGSDKELLPKAVEGVHALPRLEDCADEKALTAAVPPPEDPQVRAQVERLQAQVDRLQALEGAGKYREGTELGEQVLSETASVGFAPLHARALYQVAVLRSGVADFARAEALLHQALPLAARCGESVLEASTWIALIRNTGQGQGRYKEALGLRLPLEAAAVRAGDERVRAQSLKEMAFLLWSVGRYEESRAWHEQALALWERMLGREHPSVALTLSNLGLVLESMGRYEEALARHERALAIGEKAGEPELIATAHGELGRTLAHLGQWEAAEHHLKHALALQEKRLGLEHPVLAEVLLGLGELELDRERFSQAVPGLERALRLALGSVRAQVQLLLAHALWESAQDRPRAFALATQARESFRRLGHRHKLTEASRWLAAHPRP